MNTAQEQVRDMVGFIAVARRLNFASAAQELGLSASALSRRVASLEDRLGVRLLDRTTRKVSLTEFGAAYLEQATDIIARIEAADGTAFAYALEPRGVLRVSVASAFGHMQVTPLLPAFVARYPKLKLDLSLTDRYVDLLSGEADLAIRIGSLDDSGLIARRLAPCRLVLCASPDYVARHGRPAAPDELAAHDCLHFGALETGAAWRFGRSGGSQIVHVRGSIRIDSTDAVRRLTLAGLGVAVLATFVVGEDLAARRLVPLLPEWTLPELDIQAVHPSARLVPPKVRAFVDHLTKAFAGTPSWDRSLPPKHD